MKSPPDELLASVDRAPDALEPRRVLGDWLSENGDPRGELIALHRKEIGKSGPHLEALHTLSAHQVATHADALWGPLLEAARISTLWRMGYWDKLVVLPQQTDVAGLLRHPSARFLRHLSLRGHSSFAGPPLPQLELVEVDYDGSWVLPSIDEAPVPKKLWLRCAALEVPRSVPPLRHLRIWNPGFHLDDVYGFTQLTLAHWSELEVLELYVLSRVETITALVDRAHCPKLRSLRLTLQPGQGAKLTELCEPFEFDKVFIRLNIRGVVYTEIRSLTPLVRHARHVEIRNLDGEGYDGPGDELDDFLV